ncbi:20457_t:CDS:2, partial [Gigaspora margarita]
DHALNPDYGYVSNLFNQFHHNCVGEKNGVLMFQKLKEEVNFYNNSRKGEICYVDASVSFEPLNTSITLFYTSCIAGALPLGVLVMSDKLETALEKGMNMLKLLFTQHAFFECRPNVGPISILTDNSKHEHNALEHCWSQSK